MLKGPLFGITSPIAQFKLHFINLKFKNVLTVNNQNLSLICSIRHASNVRLMNNLMLIKKNAYQNLIIQILLN